MQIFKNARIFNGDTFLENKSLLVDEGKFMAVATAQNFSGLGVFDMKQKLIVPALIDAQIYGGNQYLFGEFPSVKALEATYQYCTKGGALHFVPTIATNSLEIMLQGIEAVKEYWAQGGKGVLGLHLEGPYISEAKRGAHLKQYVRKPELDEVKLLISKGKDVIKMMTLAPEVCSKDIIKLLRKNNIIISAGHSNATYAEAIKAFDGGINIATHLYNAMSPLNHREPGMVGAIFDSGKVRVSLVADGHHVDYAAIRIAKRLLADKLFLITDAVTENKEGHYRHQLSGDKYIMPDGTLSGSSLTMLQAVKNCIQYADISLEEALKMASLYPAIVLGIDQQKGRIEKKYDADFLVLDEALNLQAIYRAGELIDAA
ncbi:MAG: N-acetylglucosamine-6-phosphate deacetylase [Sphingobacteriales bacterium]|nr:N-acetylglucosamine-6-phosphate deacetylase [Sphingobacteriales bacterium]MBI3718251.1 N-acetylglucosamine-6-phosphate deacetylase [Sphingobacteriales bacterium]